MGKLSLDDIYSSGVDIDTLTKYYAARKKAEQEDAEKKRRAELAEQQKKMEKEVARKRKDAAVALKAYLNAMGRKDINLENVDDVLLDFEKTQLNKGKDRTVIHKGYSATKEGDKDWDIKFSGDMSDEEKDDIVKFIKEWF